MRLPGPLDHLARWRPVVPPFVVDRALRRMRGGMVTNADGSVRPLNFSERAIDRTRVLMHRQQTLLDPSPRAMRRERIALPHCSAEWLTLPESRKGHVLLYFHGGAYLRGSTDTHIGALSRFMRAARVEACSVDYRMEPQHRFPAWVEDAVDAYRDLIEVRGIAPGRIAIAGDSAGGGVAMALLQQITALELPQPACAAVISPWDDLTCSGPSHAANVDADAMFGPGLIEHTAEWLAAQAGVERDDPLLSPAFGTYPGSPPLRIDVSAVEILRSDAELLADAYRASGAHVTLVEHPTAPHAWTAIGGLSAARQSAREIGAFIDRHLA
ncbi:MAG: alpha/beta hydrolase [Solirubrobacteraceae bacterium]|nr:alpha/beta hydrolase [Solirubrobacteraceae bacterium]